MSKESMTPQERTVLKAKFWTSRVRKALVEEFCLAEDAVASGFGEWHYGGRVCNPVCSVQGISANDLIRLLHCLDDHGIHFCTFRVRVADIVEIVGPVWLVE